MSKRFPRSLAALAICTFIATQPSFGADFVRGDANGDGEVTLADSIYILTQVTEGTTPTCADAMDTDDSGDLSFADGTMVFRHMIDGRAIPAPYPTARPDHTADDLGCDSREAVEPLEDDIAELAVQDVRVSGSDDREVAIRLNLSSSVRVGAFWVEVETPDSLTPRGFYKDLTGRLAGGILEVNDETPGRFRIGLLPDIDALNMIPPREDAGALEFRVCLAPGTPAGTYPLTLVSGQLASETGRPIAPRLVSGTLTVDADVEDVACPLPPKIVDFVRGDA